MSLLRRLADLFMIRTTSLNKLLCAACVGFSSSAALALDTGITGGGQPVNNIQPSLAINTVIAPNGIYPPRDGVSPSSNYLGSVRMFAGASYGTLPGIQANGQLLSISQNTALFSVLGTNYGGDGRTTFAVPDLRGRTMVGSGQGRGLTDRAVGEQVGQPTVTLLESEMPSHTHSLPYPAPDNVTGPAGGNQAFANMQPSLALTYMIATAGIFPSPSGGGYGTQPFIGQIAAFAGNYAPGGWHKADGSLLPIAEYELLFNLIGTTYGGDGQNTFALPDLSGRAAIGFGQGQGLRPQSLGQAEGSETVTLLASQIPAHAHTVPNLAATGLTGGNQPMSNMQPTLGINYLINLNGIFPSHGSIVADPYLSEIIMFAGNFAPGGTAFAAGQFLQINQNPALYYLFGTTYGGDGIWTFALPDLRGRVLTGADQDSYSLGMKFGTETNTLLVSELPPHDHLLPVAVPEPSTLVMLAGAGLVGCGASVRGRRTVRRIGSQRHASGAPDSGAKATRH